MKINFTTPLVLVLLVSLSCIAQNTQIKRTWHWYFGGFAGLDFSSGVAVPDTNGMLAVLEGCSSISDTAGNLLFYCDGNNVWNRNHQLMPNGTGLLGCYSTWQNSVIIPQPGNDSIYFIFTADCREHAFVDGVRYSIVNMNLDSGYGDIATKNFFLFGPNQEQLAAVVASDCESVWVVSQECGTNHYRSYKVNSSGVDTVPVITAIGNAQCAPNNATVGLKFASNGKFLVTTNFWDYINTGSPDSLEIFRFNDTTGALYDRIIFSPDTTVFSYSFSPDNTKLYTTGGWLYNKVYQYDISNYSLPAILASKTLLYTFYGLYYMGSVQNAPDGKIYLVRFNHDTLAVINSPNLAGTSSGYNHSALSLDGRYNAFGLPNFIESYFDTDSMHCSPNYLTDMASRFSLSLYPNPASSSANIILESYSHSLISESINIQVFDMLGREVNLKYDLKKIGTNTLHANLHWDVLTSGIYIIKISIDESSTQLKLIINN